MTENTKYEYCENRIYRSGKALNSKFLDCKLSDRIRQNTKNWYLITLQSPVC
ncbi:hypothetical protein [Nostoc sp. C117]|uniref:hypothetical protein n=1 Tax=Nostoc sp. C117 TaxID=3349875 RepID=UPI00370DDB1D